MNKHAYFDAMTTFQELPLPNPLSVTAKLLLATIILMSSMLWIIPWQQTAYGVGIVQAENPNERIQSISALVPGQVSEWHVREGQAVKKGDPIVTLVDSDPALIERLENQITALELQKEAQEQALMSEQVNVTRQARLVSEGLASQRDLEKAKVTIQNLRAEIAKVDASINKLKVDKARQSLQTKIAPSDGFVVNLQASGSATYVKAGEVIASFIPTNIDRSAVVTVSGLDAPLIHVGRKVAIQFEGYPAILFSGWPNSSHGAFAGVVTFVEPIADPSGRFRVWIQPDSQEPPWPNDGAIQLGSRLQAWVLLEEVRLGYELWRQLNNFPAIRKAASSQPGIE